ncbi:MAG: aldo/keto reductase [Verrucomicrobia bacterium]|nr:aldo/keto reductase [Verrucomicrobiota bacterium]
MAGEKEAEFTRRQFLDRVLSGAALTTLSAYSGVVWAGEPAADSLGETLPRRPLGATGTKVTMLGLGGAHVGGLDDRTAQSIIEAALEGGIRFFDNSQGYDEGESEAKYGRFLTPKYREQVFLMTKTDAREAPDARRELEGSLRRLRTDYLDLWQMHAVESPEDVDERQRGGVIEAMVEARASGKVRHIGFTGHRTPTAHLRVLEVIDQFETCQMPINAVDPGYESFIQKVLPVLVQKNLGVLAMKTLSDQGFFGRIRWSGGRPTGVSPVIPDRLSLREAIHFVWSLPVSTLITGAESAEQVHEKVELARTFKPMSSEERQRIVQRVSDLAGTAVEYYKA